MAIEIVLAGNGESPSVVKRADGLFMIASRNQAMIASESELRAICGAFDRIFYKEDVIDWFCDREDTPYDGNAIEKDESLVERMTDFYTERRGEHSTGGEIDSVAHWTVSMRETENEFYGELAKYRAADENDKNGGGEA